MNREGVIVAVFPGRAFGADVITLRGRNDRPGFSKCTVIWAYMSNWEGGFVCGGWNGCLCPESRGRNGREWSARFGLWMVELSGEGEMVEGFNKTSGGALLNHSPATEPPSRFE